ncbi:MAG: phenylacetate--CoA ligase [Solirubrobacterales bacterium]|nr:phenylacetate--CoA ligase [Solirubrobacterales bacterium]
MRSTGTLTAGVSETPQIWDPAETLAREELQSLQLERLRATVGRVLTAQPLGAERLRQAGIESEADVRELADLTRVPFALKSDLRENYPFGLLAVPREEIVRVHASSGTHGQPTVVGYTRADLETWTELMARCMTMAGVRPGMLIHNANGYGLFTGGLGFHQGGERIGATVVPVSGGMTARQAMLLRDFGAQVLVSTPSYALVIAQALADAGVDPAGTPLELGLFGGEPWTDGLRTQIDRALGIKAINFYGLSEMCGPGVATECLTAREGLHVNEDHFVIEVIDPQTEQPVAPGATGELVFTTLTKEALPLIRYRTGDLGAITTEPCTCGRTTARLIRLGGRKDDMMIIRGVNLYPSHVEQLLLSVEGVAPHWRLVLERTGPMDELTLECEPAQSDVDRDELANRLEHVLKEGTGVRIVVSLLDPGGVPRSEGKAVRVVDRRGS